VVVSLLDNWWGAWL